jgi:hypothetical protein
MEEMRYNFALRWFVGLSMGEEPWDVTVFTKNRDRFLKGAVAEAWLQAVVREAHQAKLLDEEHFSVDGTLIRAWASERSYRPKDDPPAPGQGTGRRGKLLKRDVFASRTDPEARSYRRSQRDVPRLSYLGHIAMENGHGLIVASKVTQASTRAEREAATDLLGRKTERYRRSLARRGWIERCFAWIKGPGGQGRARFRGTPRISWSFQFAAGVYNLLRMLKLAPQT